MYTDNPQQWPIHRATSRMAASQTILHPVTHLPRSATVVKRLTLAFQMATAFSSSMNTASGTTDWLAVHVRIGASTTRDVHKTAKKVCNAEIQSDYQALTVSDSLPGGKHAALDARQLDQRQHILLLRRRLRCCHPHVLRGQSGITKTFRA